MAKLSAETSSLFACFPAKEVMLLTMAKIFVSSKEVKSGAPSAPKEGKGFYFQEYLKSLVRLGI